MPRPKKNPDAPVSETEKSVNTVIDALRSAVKEPTKQARTTAYECFNELLARLEAEAEARKALY